MLTSGVRLWGGGRQTLQCKTGRRWDAGSPAQCPPREDDHRAAWGASDRARARPHVPRRALHRPRALPGAVPGMSSCASRRASVGHPASVARRRNGRGDGLGWAVVRVSEPCPQKRRRVHVAEATLIAATGPGRPPRWATTIDALHAGTMPLVRRREFTAAAGRADQCCRLGFIFSPAPTEAVTRQLLRREPIRPH